MQEYTSNDPRAAHKVYSFGFGTNVKIPMGRYEISLATDGSNTCVFIQDGDEVLFETSGTDGYAIENCIAWINSYGEEYHD